MEKIKLNTKKAEQFLNVRSDVCRQLLSDSTSQWTPLLSSLERTTLQDGQ